MRAEQTKVGAVRPTWSYAPEQQRLGFQSQRLLEPCLSLEWMCAHTHSMGDPGVCSHETLLGSQEDFRDPSMSLSSFPGYSVSLVSGSTEMNWLTPVSPPTPVP
jgi:hypothetical protein